MKWSVRAYVTAAACFFLALVFSPSADARPPYLSVFVETYPYLRGAVTAVEKGNCNICHDAGSPSKRGRSEYGKALASSIKALAGASRKLDTTDPEEKQTLVAAIRQAGEAKSRSGKTFGAVIESGRLPVPVAPRR